MNVALGEITLILFTTLAPSGALAFVFCSLVLLFFNPQPQTALRLTQLLLLPIFISMVGLIASATHLGSPDNSLYAFAGIGRSPLSNEVAAAVVFLFFAGTYWLMSFSSRVPKVLGIIWLVLGCASALVFVHSVASAYAVLTIETWNTLFSSVSLWLLALVGGSLLSILTIAGSTRMVVCVDKEVGEPFARYSLVVLALGFASFVASVVVFLWQRSFFAHTLNGLGSVLEQFPQYDLFLLLYALCALLGMGIVAVSYVRNRVMSLNSALAATLLVLLGIFCMRFSFYATHMTSGF